MTLVQRLTAKTKQGGVFRRRNGQRLSAKTNGATQFLTAILTKLGQTLTYVKLCDYDETPCGILELLADTATLLTKDSVSPYADGVNIKYTNPDNDDEFLVTLGEGRGCTREEICVVDQDNPGFAQSMAPDNESIAQVPPFRIIGKFMETLSASGGNDQLAWVKKI